MRCLLPANEPGHAVVQLEKESLLQFKCQLMGKLNIGVFALIFSCTFYLQSYSQEEKLFKIFPLSSPELQGLNSSTLDSLLLFVRNTNQNIHHVTIIRN